jgi:hypothetical protein
LPALSKVHAERRVAGEVVIAVAGLTNSVIAANDDVGRERITSTEVTVGCVCGADELASG